MLLRFDHSDRIHSLVFDDNGRVAHAYLKEGERIVADVWLYNRCPTPEAPEWKDRSKMPFANPKGFVAPLAFEFPGSPKDVGVRWSDAGAGPPVVVVLIRGEEHATMAPGEKPGRCRLAAKDGPLARMLATA